MLYEVDELLDFILLFIRETTDIKGMKKKDLRDSIKGLRNKGYSLLETPCAARLPGGSAICNRPLNHLGAHRQQEIKWEGPRQ